MKPLQKKDKSGYEFFRGQLQEWAHNNKRDVTRFIYGLVEKKVTFLTSTTSDSKILLSYLLSFFYPSSGITEVVFLGRSVSIIFSHLENRLDYTL